MPAKTKPSKPGLKPDKRKSLDCEVFFLLRIHGKGSDKTITVKKEQDPRGHQLLPLFGNDSQREEYQKLIHRSFAPPATIKVPHSGEVPTERDFFAAAQRYVRRELGHDVLDARGIASKWNKDTRTWDPIPSASSSPQPQLAYGYVISSGTNRVESFVAVDAQTLFVDFVVYLQGEVSP